MSRSAERAPDPSTGARKGEERSALTFSYLKCASGSVLTEAKSVRSMLPGSPPPDRGRSAAAVRADRDVADGRDGSVRGPRLRRWDISLTSS